MFPSDIDPPLYPEESGVMAGIFSQPPRVFSGGVGVRQFSGAIIFTLESWEKKKSGAESPGGEPGFKIICHWRRQVYPNNPEILRALEAKTDDGTAWEQLKRAIGMLKRVPLVRGCAIVLKFGHRGYNPPIIQVIPDFRFGFYVVQEEVEEAIRDFRDHEAKLRIQFWRMIQGLAPWATRTPTCPMPVTSLPDAWDGNTDIQMISAQFERVIASLLRRIEQRERIAEAMVNAGIDPAPGDQHTVVALGRDAEAAITGRLMRAGGVTTYQPEPGEDPLIPIAGSDDLHGFRPGSRGKTARPSPRASRPISMPTGLGNAADHRATAPPPSVCIAVIPRTTTPNLAEPRIRRSDSAASLEIEDD